MNFKKYLFHFNEVYASFRIRVSQIIEILLLFLSFLGVASIIYYYGFDLNSQLSSNLKVFFEFIIDVFLVLILLRIILNIGQKRKRQAIVFDFILLLFLGLFVIEKYFFSSWLEINMPVLYFLKQNIFIYVIILTVFIVEMSKRSLFMFIGKVNPALLFVGSFAFIIIAGTGLLLLPKATNHGISFIDALFTSTSAVCVTGLVSVDTATTFTGMGKGVILVLIQLGGLGVMTFTSFFGLFFTGSNSFKGSVFIKDMINDGTLSDIFKNLMKIILFTFVIELIGAIIIFMNMNWQVYPDSLYNIKFSIFHSISAFCNAGFSTLSQNLYDINFRFNYPVHITVAFLIILGGIGFPILLNYYKLIKHYFHNLFRVLKGKRYLHIPNIINVNTRLVLYTTLFLLVFGTVAYMLFESNNTLRNHNFFGKIAEAFFASVTARTAGYNTFDYGAVMPVTVLLTILLMWIGASPGSTGGGIKTSSFAIAALNVFSIARGKDRIEIWRREIADDSVRKAFATILLSLLAIGISVTLVSYFDADKSLDRIAFECFSAFGTVGLSMNLTPTLTEASKYVLVFTMFLGRVGTLTIFVIFIRKVVTLKYKFPEENIIIS